jgi:hypothetical protein
MSILGTNQQLILDKRIFFLWIISEIVPPEISHVRVNNKGFNVTFHYHFSSALIFYSLPNLNYLLQNFT